MYDEDIMHKLNNIFSGQITKKIFEAIQISRQNINPPFDVQNEIAVNNFNGILASYFLPNM